MGAGKYSDAINMELLQLATLLMRNMPSSMATHRKELIKFGWNHLKREESSNKYHAFLNVCHFLEAYQAPEKIVLQASSISLVSCSHMWVLPDVNYDPKRLFLLAGRVTAASSAFPMYAGVRLLYQSGP